VAHGERLVTAPVRHAMRACTAALLAAVLACVAAVLVAAALSYAAPLPRPRAVPGVDRTWGGHDAPPLRPPPKAGPHSWSTRFHRSVTDPVSHVFDVPDKLLWGASKFGAHPAREAVNVNAFDEVANSSWFTNRNHVRAVPVAEIRNGPDA